MQSLARDNYLSAHLMQSLARDNYLSALIIAIMLGIAVGRSYTCAHGEIRQSRNPLFRLFTHVYLSLFAMHDWVQALALWATVPILIGAVLTMPNIMDTLSLTRLYMASVTVVGFGQCLVVVPTIFYVVVRQNPYRWMHKMLAPISYGMVLQNAFLSLPLATKAALRTHEISPSTFGAVYPLLSALNRSHFAIGCPTAVLYVAAFSGCDVKMTAGNVLVMFGVTFLGCIGDAALSLAGMSYFLMVWRAFCVNEDTPSSVLMIATIGILIYRVSACVGTTTNLLLTRIVAHAVDHEDTKWQQQATEAEGLAHEHGHRGD
jgi:Na+/H+-dicarboxylate symporter